MKTKQILLAVIATSVALCSVAQTTNGQNRLLANEKTEYKTAIGLRAGETSGLTVKQFLGGSTALEGILGVWNHGISATLLFEKHAPAFGATGLKWYYGAGGHVAFAGGRYFYYYDRGRYYRYIHGNTGIGIDGILGLEYKIAAIPFAISLDLKPYMEVVSNGNIWLSLDPGLGIKVAF